MQRGDHILVTDRGRIVAELRFPDASALVESPADGARALLAARGRLRLAQRRTTTYEVSPVKGSCGLGRNMLDAERGEW